MVKWTWRPSCVLGLAVGERAILCAQAGVNGGATVQKLARFELSGDAWQNVAATGAALRAFLRQHGITATHAAIGLPARWLVAHDREVPPADEAQAGAMLRLQVERLVAADHTDVVFDYAGRPDPAQTTRVLLVGTVRQKLDQVVSLASASGLTTVGVTATALATGGLLSRDDDRTMVMLSEHGAELVAMKQGRVHGLRHLALGAGGDEEFARFASEVRRAVALSPGAGQAAAAQLLRWDCPQLSDRQLAELSRSAGLEPCGKLMLDSLGVHVSPAALNGSLGGLAPQSFVPAVAVALSGLRGARLPVDFLHSRLAAPRVRHITRLRVLAIAAVAAVILGLVGLYLTVTQRESDATALQARLKAMAPDIKAAEAAVARVSLGRGYYRTRPPVLDCLGAVTMAVRDDDPLWITSFNFRDTNRGQLQGKASEQQMVLAFLDRLRGDPRFSDVQLMDMRDAGGRSRDIAFSIGFAFRGGERAQEAAQ